jgi:hypothetical protein
VGFSGGGYSSLYYTNSDTVDCAEVHWEVTVVSNGQVLDYNDTEYVKPSGLFATPTFIDSGYYVSGTENRSVVGTSAFSAFTNLC